ncbi:MAG: aldo/keto reductase [Maritimibacter sp.]|nr:aldo/keto reductase [Maritimibacter sp.]
MRHKLLGTTGLRVSEIGLGTLNFGETKDWGVAPETARQILDGFAGAGGTLLDTAPNYAGGASEQIIGDFLKGQRDDFVVSTKYTASTSGHILAGGNSARTMIRSLEESLGRLGTDYVDIFWLHYWDGTTPMAEIVKAFDALVTAGKIRHFGFSDTPAWLVSRAVTMAELRGWSMPAAVQIEYSLAARDAERELLPMADALGLGAVGWGPLAAGALAGGAAPARRQPEALPAPLRTVAEAVSGIAAEAGLSPLAAALRWLLRGRAAHTLVPLVGARTPEQLATILTAAEGDLDAEVLDALSAATAPKLGFPHDLIGSRYLRQLAVGRDAVLEAPPRPRA